MFVTMVAANVSVLVVGSIPTGIALVQITPGMGSMTETLHIVMTLF